MVETHKKYIKLETKILKMLYTKILFGDSIHKLNTL